MAQYSYSRDFNPPAPVLLIRVAAPGSPFALAVTAMVDSGAYMTILPAQVIEALHLPRVGSTEASGAFDEGSVECDVFAVEVATEFASPEIARIIVFSKSYALLGRDFLNRWKVSLDGPQGLLEITV